MQITVTVEELRAYQQKYQQWAQSNRDSLFLQAFMKLPARDKDALGVLISQMKADLESRTIAWKKTNQEPKLIPSI